MPRRSLCCAIIFAGAFVAAPATAQLTDCNEPGSGADVIVGDLPDIQNYASQNGIEAFAVGTTSCNVGDEELLWIANTNEHPVIAQNFFKWDPDAGTFEQLGQSWLKHGFFALQQTLCCECIDAPSNRLGVGCADPYGAGLNGDAPDLGPKHEVNAHTGIFAYPPSNPLPITPNVGRRLQIPITKLEASATSTVRYFVEGQYIAPDDAAAGNGNNNASYREVLVDGAGPGWNFSLTGATMREQPAIRAWASLDPDVLETDVQIPGEGLIIVASKATDLGNGFWHYEYAVHNLNSDRSIQSFEVPVGAGVGVFNIGFNDPEWHSGEPYDNTDWVGVRTATTVRWDCDSFAVNPNASALRWGTMGTFRFDANFGPEDHNAIIGLFKPGTPASVSAAVRTPPVFIGPQDCNDNGVDDVDDIANGDALDCNGNLVPDSCEAFETCELTTELITAGLSSPVGVYHAPDDADRLFVVEQGGRIRIIDLTTNLIRQTDFLDLSTQVSSGGERGLLSMAFDPDYAVNGRFYVNYTDVNGDTVISRWTVSGSPDVADAGSEVVIDTIAQDFANHNGGQLQFGRDGYLYCGTGDGGSANDPNNRAQDLGSKLGKMLRYDVNGAPPYHAPGNLTGAIWASGKRNPWKFSVDRITGLMYIADVGQDDREEINVVPDVAPAGLNFGWRCLEGTLCTGLSGCDCANGSLVAPVKEEFHSDGITCSITGGYVYRGCGIPWMQGRYFYSDYCAGYIRSFVYDETTDSVIDERDHTVELAEGLFSIVAFGEDADGELYIVSNGSQVRRIVCVEETIGECGDGIVQFPEECDPPNSQTCDCNCNAIDGTTLFLDDFNTDQGWTAMNAGATSGDWERGAPVDDATWDFDPFSDGDGSGAAYLTGNAFGNTDVDNGSVTLTSPTIDMSAGNIIISYDYFLRLTNTDGAIDRLLVEVNSNDGAGVWTPIITHATDGGLVWRRHTILQADLDAAGVTLTSTMRVRFTVNDGDPQSIVEAGIDGFDVSTTAGYIDCNANCVADADDIAMGTSFDCNDNGIPDECEMGGARNYPVVVAPPISIPDGSGAFVTSTFTVPESGTIEDLDVALTIAHTYNGDLTVTLTHNGVTAVLVDRPGYVDTGFGTDNDGLDIVLDDQGLGGGVEDANAGGGALVSPPSYVPNEALSLFSGMNKQGDWTLAVSDSATNDVGTLSFWELRVVNTGGTVTPCDCNENGVRDDDDIAMGTSLDCDANGLPDECDIDQNPLLDCDGGPIGLVAGGDNIINTFCFGCHNTDGSGGKGFPGPNIRNSSRTFLTQRLTAPTSHPGGAFGFSAQEFADLEAFLADGGSRGRPDGLLDACQDLPDCDDNGASDGCELEKGTQVDMNWDGVPDDCLVVLPCPWDCSPAGGNGVINIDDLFAVINALGQPGGPCDVAPDNGDGTFGNGLINVDDLFAVLNRFGACP